MSRKSGKSTYRDAGGDLRLPPPFEGVQVNSCRNPACSGFGVEALSKVDRGRPRADGTSRFDNYRANGDDGGTADQKLLCKLCGKTSPIKSKTDSINQGISMAFVPHVWVRMRWLCSYSFLRLYF